MVALLGLPVLLLLAALLVIRRVSLREEREP